MAFEVLLIPAVFFLSFLIIYCLFVFLIILLFFFNGGL